MISSDNKNMLSLTEEILGVLKETPEGISQDKLTTLIPFKEQEIVECLNSLIESNSISVLTGIEGMIFKYRNPKDAMKFKELTKDQISVYELIIQSGSNGISLNDLKIRMRIESSSFINRILDCLQKKYLIKFIKILNSKNKKLYIGIDIEPSLEITGGVWCNNQEFDNELVSVFYNKCYDYIAAQKGATRKEILLHARCTNLIQSDIKEEDIQKILNLLVFDNKIEAIFPEISKQLAVNKHSLLIAKTGNNNILNEIRYQKNKVEIKAVFDSVPCSLCKVFNECKVSNVVNPLECPYMKNFL